MVGVWVLWLLSSAWADNVQVYEMGDTVAVGAEQHVLLASPDGLLHDYLPEGWSSVLVTPWCGGALAAARADETDRVAWYRLGDDGLSPLPGAEALPARVSDLVLAGSRDAAYVVDRAQGVLHTLPCSWVGGEHMEQQLIAGEPGLLAPSRREVRRARRGLRRAVDRSAQPGVVEGHWLWWQEIRAWGRPGTFGERIRVRSRVDLSHDRDAVLTEVTALWRFTALDATDRAPARRSMTVRPFGPGWGFSERSPRPYGLPEAGLWWSTRDGPYGVARTSLSRSMDVACEEQAWMVDFGVRHSAESVLALAVATTPEGPMVVHISSTGELTAVGWPVGLRRRFPLEPGPVIEEAVALPRSVPPSCPDR